MHILQMQTMAHLNENYMRQNCRHKPYVCKQTHKYHFEAHNSKSIQMFISFRTVIHNTPKLVLGEILSVAFLARQNPF